MAITQTITALPSPPDPNTDDSTTFSSKASSFTVALVTMGSQLNTLVSQLNTEVANINTFTGVSMKYTFSTTTTDSDPGAGFMRLSTSTQNIATVVRLDTTDANGSVVTGVIDLFDDSSSVHKGFLRVQHATDVTRWMVFNVTALASPAGYKNITVSVAASSATSPFANNDPVVVSFVRTGDIATGTVTSAQIQSQTFTAFTTTGTSTAYVLTPSPAAGALAAGLSYSVFFHTACGASPTINISGLGAISLYKVAPDGSFITLSANDIKTNHYSRITLLSGTQALVEHVSNQPSIIYGTATSIGTGVNVLLSSIPSWVREIEITLSTVSTNGTSNLFVQVGDAGGVEATGYAGSSGSMTNGVSPVTSAGGASGWTLLNGVAADSITGVVRLTSFDSGNLGWIMTSILQNGAGKVIVSGGVKTLTQALDRIQLWAGTNGTDVFDGGTYNWTYKG
jgi:hypothetical protein